MPPAASNALRIWNHGSPILMPSALASLVRLTTQPSLYLNDPNS